MITSNVTQSDIGVKIGVNKRVKMLRTDPTEKNIQAYLNLDRGWPDKRFLVLDSCSAQQIISETDLLFPKSAALSCKR